MRIIFGHDWREDGVMQAIADFAAKVASGARNYDIYDSKFDTGNGQWNETPRMLNIVPAEADKLSRAAIEAQNVSAGVLKVLSLDKAVKECRVADSDFKWKECNSPDRVQQMTALRNCMTALLNPGCRICLGGKIQGYEGKEPGIMEEARLALNNNKPLYLIGGFGGATREFGTANLCEKINYWQSDNGLNDEDKNKLFGTSDIELALGLIASGIERRRNETQRDTA